MVVLRIAAAGHAGQTKRPLVVDGIRVIERTAFGVLRAAGEAEMSLFSKLRTLGAFHHQTARNALTIQGRRGAFDHIDTFQEPRIHLNGVIAGAIAENTQSIEEGVVNITAVEAAQGDGVIARCATGKVGEYARRVVQRSVNRGGVLVVHLLTRYNGYSLAGGNDRLVGFSRRSAGF